MPFVPPVIQQGSNNADRPVRSRYLEKQHATVGAIVATEKGGGGIVGARALRQYLHAIHACPTASAAWLNASEVLGAIISKRP